MSVTNESLFSQDISTPNTSLHGMNGACQIYVQIIEEPENEIKFRYENERRLSSRITGVNSTEKRKTYPTIKIHGYQGAACVVASLVTVEPPFYPHPHKLAGKSCVNGVFYKIINSSEMTFCFSDLRFQAVKRENVQTSLAMRQAAHIDPFGTGFSHSFEPRKINYNAVRLCFQVFLPDKEGNFCIPLAPVISAPINNIAVSDLQIVKLSHCSAPISGEQEVILLCGQVKKNDIEIVFYEKNEKEEIIWSDTGKFYLNDVHRQAAIPFKTPPYINPNHQKKVKCFICLRRPSDKIMGEPREFTLFPPKADSEVLAHKQRKFKALDLSSILQLNCLVSQNSGAVRQQEANCVPENRFISPASASVSKIMSNNGNASFSHSEVPLPTANAEENRFVSQASASIPKTKPNNGNASFFYSEIPFSATNAETSAIIQIVHQNADGKCTNGQTQGSIRLIEDKDVKTTSFDSLEKIITSAVDVNPNDLLEIFSGMSIDCIFEASVDVNAGKTEDEQDNKINNGNAEALLTNTKEKLKSSDLPFDSNNLSGNLSGMTIDSITESVGLIAAGLFNEKILNEQVLFEDNISMILQATGNCV